MNGIKQFSSHAINKEEDPQGKLQIDIFIW